MIKKIDNFLEKDEFKRLQEFVFSNNFPWYFIDDKIPNSKNSFNFHLYHIVVKEGQIRSNSFNLLKPVFDKLKAKEILRTKFNMVTKTQKIIKYDLHRDSYEDNFKIAILYLNTNNGYTYFKNGEKIKSVENRLITFDNKLLHSGTNCTDKNNRIIVNINYK